jgi:hypothetical protein
LGTLENQEVAQRPLAGFLGRLAKARCAVPLPMPSSEEIAAQERPSSRRTAILEASAATRGLPRCLPRLLASARPERARSRINSRSNSAKGSDYLSIPVCHKCHEDIRDGRLTLTRERYLELCLIYMICFLNCNRERSRSQEAFHGGTESSTTETTFPQIRGG